MALFKFTALAKENPRKISAEALDANFKQLEPIPQDGNKRQYAINRTPSGWQLILYPNQPSGVVVPEPPTSGTFVLGSINGQMSWFATQSC